MAVKDYTVMVIDITPVLTEAANLLIPVIAGAFAVWLRKHLLDKWAADLVDKTLPDAVAMMQSASDGELQKLHPHIDIPSQPVAVGVQFMLDHAGDALTRIGASDPDKIASKLIARQARMMPHTMVEALEPINFEAPETHLHLHVAKGSSVTMAQPKVTDLHVTKPMSVITGDDAGDETKVM